MRVRPVASNQAHSSTRRIRRHDQRVAALAVTGVLVAGLGVGIGLGGDGGAPTVDQPPPTVTGPGPTVPSTAVTRPAAAPGERPTTFTGDLGGRVAVRSTRTGKVVRTLFWPHPFATRSYAVGMSPDRATVYFSNQGPDPCEEPGVFRVPAGGGQPVRVVGGENAEGMIKVSADGSKLAYLGSPCQVGSRVDVVVRDAGGGLVGRWPTASAGGGLLIDRPSLSPDGRLLTAPDPGCVIVQAEFQPRTGRLAAFERCLAGDPQTTTTPPRFRLVYLDPSSGRLLSRSLTFDDDGGADLTVASMDFDQSGRHLLYWVSSHDPMDSQKARPATGTWRYSGGTAVRIQDDRRDGSGYRITTRDPTW